jgi:hypothetical protein
MQKDAQSPLLFEPIGLMVEWILEKVRKNRKKSWFGKRGDTTRQDAYREIPMASKKKTKKKDEKELTCPGGKIRSKGKGRGLGLGKGRGPMGIPLGAKEAYEQGFMDKVAQMTGDETLGQSILRGAGKGALTGGAIGGGIGGALGLGAGGLISGVNLSDIRKKRKLNISDITRALLATLGAGGAGAAVGGAKGAIFGAPIGAIARPASRAVKQRTPSKKPDEKQPEEETDKGKE